MKRLSDQLSESWKLYMMIFELELSKSGMTKPQIMVIHQLKEEPQTIGDISKKLELSYSTVSGIIDRLEKADLVKRRRDLKDRRLVWVSLVHTFSELQARFPYLKQEYLPNIFHGMNEEESEEITQALSVVNMYLTKKYRSLLKERGKVDEHFEVCD